MDSSVMVMCMLEEIKHEAELINHSFKISDFKKFFCMCNSKIKSMDRILPENEELKSKTKDLSSRLEALGQYSKSNNVAIKVVLCSHHRKMSCGIYYKC